MLDENRVIESIDEKNGYKYLGQRFFPTNDVKTIVESNFKKRKIHIAKYYGWLNVNETTPIEIKLTVWDSCVMTSMLYASECWGDISYLERELLLVETKALKAILKVKSGTTNDLVYWELQRPTIMAKIKDAQYKFFQKVIQLSPNDAILASVIQLCRDIDFLKHYYELDGNACSTDMESREQRIRESTNSMCRYYHNMNFQKKSCIYNSMTNDHYRYIISRWRLSNHDLRIETGRYTKPITPREERNCDTCNTIEDEHHVIFDCPKYDTVRNGHETILSCNAISTFLDCSYTNIRETASILHEIERFRKEM